MDDLFSPHRVGGETLTARVDVDDELRALAQSTDYTFTGESTFTLPSFIPPRDFSLGLIVGSSGTGKSSLLRHFGETRSFEWVPTKAVASQVDPKVLMRVGLSSVPSLCRPFHVLSEGEKHRAELARALSEGVSVIDEFTSVVHRHLAMSISIGLRKFIDTQQIKNIVLATCHEDVIEWLEPDWVFNTNTGALVEGRSVRQRLDIQVTPCSPKDWAFFAPHHYLTGEIRNTARCWVATLDGRPCAFTSVLPLVNRIKNAWRGHRTCVHPDFQGMGVGSTLSEAVAQMHIDAGLRFFSKTAHPAFGEHRNKSSKWRGTAENGKARQGYLRRVGQVREGYGITDDTLRKHAHRVCYAHEYIGEGAPDVVLAPSSKDTYYQPTLL